MIIIQVQIEKGYDEDIERHPLELAREQVIKVRAKTRTTSMD